jgi:putative mRNA 3-end processing factor
LDRGFVLSDHVDWPSLLSTIQATQAQEVWVTHGYRETVVRYLTELRMKAKVLETQFEGELDDQPLEVAEA